MKATVKNDGKVRGKIKHSKIILPAKDTTEEQFRCITEASEYRKRSAIKLEEHNEVRGWVAILTRNANSGEVKVRREWVPNKEAFQVLIQSEEYKTSKVIESMPVSVLESQGVKKLRESFNFDYFLTGDYGDSTGGQRATPPNNEFYPIMGGPYSKQLYLHDYLDMHAKCFEAKNHNPLAKQVVRIKTNYTIGKGVKLIFSNAKCQDYWDRWAKEVDFTSKNRSDNDQLTWGGEVMTRLIEEQGRLRMQQIDPSTVWEVVTEPTDIEKVYYYHQQYPTQYQLLYGKKKGEKAMEYIINDIPASEMLHVKVNCAAGEKRGRSDLFPVLTDLKRFKDWLNARVTKAQIEESWAIKKKVQGSDTDVSAIINDTDLTTIPPPGAMIVENESVDTTYMTPTVSSAGSATDNVGEQLRSVIATGVGVSPEILGVGGAASTQATAISKAEPVYKEIDTRQQINEVYVSEIADRVIAFGIKKGEVPKEQIRRASLATIKRAIMERDWKGLFAEAKALVLGQAITEPTDTGFEVIHPEILTEDRTAKIKDIFSAFAGRMFSHRRASEMTAKELGVTTYDYDKEMEDVREEGESQAIQMFDQATLSASGLGATKPEETPKAGSSLDKGDYKQQAKTK